MSNSPIGRIDRFYFEQISQNLEPAPLRWGARNVPHWRTLLLQVLGEHAPLTLRKLCSQLEDALFLRFQELAQNETTEAAEERREMQHACDRLAIVLTKKLGFPTWGTRETSPS